MEWRNIQAVVPAVVSIPERSRSLGLLLAALARQCPGLTVTVAPQWQTRPGVEPRAAFEAIEQALRSVWAPWVFYFEEDVELSQTFGTAALDVLKSAEPDWAGVSFFSRGRGDRRRMADGERIVVSMPFVYAQCVAVRREVAEYWRGRILDWWDAAPRGKQKAPDMALSDCCEELGRNIVTSLPSLVQHRRIPSAFGHDTEGVYALTFPG